ncbi:MAG TPA: hypothetical protein VM370_09750 [Candidatus Thermoplasmatota archaeon]|nr:hypothetical protein [Candidatus Thermoplasmatota archaeon]
MVGEGLEWDDWVGLALAIVAGILFFIALRAYRRTRTTRVLLFAAAFGMYFVKELVGGAGPVLPVGESLVDTVELLADASVLLLFFLGTTRP